MLRNKKAEEMRLTTFLSFSLNLKHKNLFLDPVAPYFFTNFVYTTSNSNHILMRFQRWYSIVILIWSGFLITTKVSI